MRKVILTALAVLALTAPLSAQQPAQPRTLEVPATARWQHARSGVILPVRVGTLPRASIDDTTANEVDVIAQYGNDDTRVSIILFRPQIADVGLWFDRAEQVLRFNTNLGTVTPQGDGPTLVTWRDRSTATGLRRSYRGDGQWRTSATAVVGTGRWLIKIRASSRSDDLAAIDQLIDAAMRAIVLPTPTETVVPVPRIILPCAEAGRWRDARIVQPDMMTALLGATEALASEEDDDNARLAGPADVRPTALPQNLCRDPVAINRSNAAVYRVPGEARNFWVLIGDSGSFASIGTNELAGLINRTRSVALRLHEPQQTLVYADFNARPAPAQVIAVIEGMGPISSVTFDPEIRPAAPTENRPNP